MPRKGSLSSISNRDVFVLYCLLKKYHINWGVWIRAYMFESGENSNPSATLPYGLLISRIMIKSQVDLSGFQATEISATYDSRKFASMGYTLIDKKWHKKDSIKAKADAPKPTRIPADAVALLLKEVEEIKSHLTSLDSNMQGLPDIIEKVLQLSKDTSTEVGKLRLDADGLKREGISTVNKLIKQVGSMNVGVNSSNNLLAVLSKPLTLTSPRMLSTPMILSAEMFSTL